MSGILTAEEQAFFKKLEEMKSKHKEAAAKYRQANKDKISENNKNNEEQNLKLTKILS
jgi:hypothetical protein